MTFAPTNELNPLPLPVIIPTPVFNVPATLTPVPVIMSTLALPALLILTFPLIVGISTLLVPLLMPVPVGTAAQVRPPEPFVCR